MEGLGKRHKKFVNEYLKDLNATQAAIRCGYSKKSAESTGWKILSYPKVQEAIAIAKKTRESRTLVTQDRVVVELAKIAFSDPRAVMAWDEDGVHIKPSSELSDKEAAQVCEVSSTESKAGRTTRLRQHDKLKALELLGRHLGMFTDGLNVNASVEVMTKEQRDAAVNAALLGSTS